MLHCPSQPWAGVCLEVGGPFCVPTESISIQNQRCGFFFSAGKVEILDFLLYVSGGLLAEFFNDWVVSAVSLLRDSWVFRCRKETEVCCHCRIPWESLRSLCWVTAQAALPACVYPRAGKACPMERTKCTGVGHTWKPLAVLLPGEGGPSSHQSDCRAGRFLMAHFCFSEQQPQEMHASFLCQDGCDT